MSRIMSTATQAYYLKRFGLPWLTRTQRRASWETYQGASTWSNLEVDGIPGPLTTADVKRAAAHGYRIAPHFKLQEFRCGCGGRYAGCRIAAVDRELVRALERTRAKLYPRGLSIVSGYRCRTFNARVGGIRTSAHLDGRAADIPAKAEPQAFVTLGFHGIGYRSHGKVTHVDIARNVRPNTFFKE